MKKKLFLKIILVFFLVGHLSGCNSSGDSDSPKQIIHEEKQSNSNWDNMNWDNNNWYADKTEPNNQITHITGQENHSLNAQGSSGAENFVQYCIQNIPDNIQKNQRINSKESYSTSTEYSSSGMIIEITKMPPLGSRIQNLEGRVYPFDMMKHTIQIAILLNGKWHKKPGNNRNYSITINKLGEFSCDITTEPNDHLTKKIAVFVFPAGIDISATNNLSAYPCIAKKIFERE